MTDRRTAESRDLRALLHLGAVADLTDGELLDRCSGRPGPPAELAFEVLVGRHGGMVLEACRRVLGDSHDAEDAFQATFLILDRRAKSIRGRESVASWLYGVALRVASNARRARARRGALERKAARPESGSPIDPSVPDVARVVSEELGRLPDRFRSAVVLCDLEGLSHEEAARQLGCPLGTIKSRQARGRDRLKGLLARRGFAPSVAALGLASLAEAGAANLPDSLLELITKVASRIARGDPATRIGYSAAVAALTEGTLKAMLLTRLKLVAGIVLLLGTVAVGVGSAIQAPGGKGAPVVAPVPAPATAGEPDVRALRKVADAVRPTDDPSSRFYTLIEIAKAQTRAGDREGARESSKKALEAAQVIAPAIRTLPFLIVAWTLEGAGDRAGGEEPLRLARDTISAMTDTNEIVGVQTLYAATQADRGDRDGARETLGRALKLIEAIPDRTRRSGSLSSLIGTMAYVGDYPEAFEIAKAQSQGDDYFQGMYLGQIAQGAAAEAMFSMQPRRAITPEARKEAMEALHQINRVAEKFQFAEQRPDVDLATGFARLGDFDTALRVAWRIGKGPIRYRHMIDLTAGPYALGVIGSSQGKAGHLDEARRTFREAQELVDRDPNLATPIGRSRVPQVASMQADAGDVEGALKALEIIPRESRAGLLIEIADAQAKAGDREASRASFRRALEEVDRMVRDRDNQKTDGEKAQVISIRAKMGDFGAANEVFATIKEANYRGWAARDLARARASGGDIEGALAWAIALEPASTRVWALRGLAEGVRPLGGPNAH